MAINKKIVLICAAISLLVYSGLTSKSNDIFNSTPLTLDEQLMRLLIQGIMSYLILITEFKPLNVYFGTTISYDFKISFIQHIIIALILSIAQLCYVANLHEYDNSLTLYIKIKVCFALIATVLDILKIKLLPTSITSKIDNINFPWINTIFVIIFNMLNLNINYGVLLIFLIKNGYEILSNVIWRMLITMLYIVLVILAHIIKFKNMYIDPLMDYVIVGAVVIVFVPLYIFALLIILAIFVVYFLITVLEQLIIIAYEIVASSIANL